MESKRSARIAIIVAAGSGTRFGAKKQFVKINGEPLYYYALKAFEPHVDYRILVVPEEDIGSVEPYGSILVAGGETRYQSVFNAIIKIMDIDNDSIDKNSIVLIHDGVRPAITGEVINNVIEDAECFDAAVASVPIVDTVRTVSGEIVDRMQLRAIQTPQGFKLGILKQAYERFIILPQKVKDSMKITDDAQILDEMLGVKAHLSDGDSANIKITSPTDMQNLHFY